MSDAQRLMADVVSKHRLQYDDWAVRDTDFYTCACGPLEMARTRNGGTRTWRTRLTPPLAGSTEPPNPNTQNDGKVGEKMQGDRYPVGRQGGRAIPKPRNG